MTKYASYETMSDFIKVLEPFKGNSVEAVKNRSNYYIVYSYNTIVAVVAPCGKAIINITYYSRTTSRIQNILRLLFPKADLLQHTSKKDIWYQNLDMYNHAEHLKK